MAKSDNTETPSQADAKANLMAAAANLTGPALMIHALNTVVGRAGVKPDRSSPTIKGDKAYVCVAFDELPGQRFQVAVKLSPYKERKNAKRS